VTAGWQPTELVATGLAALALAAVVLAGGRLHPLSAVTRDQRKRVSFCAGMAAAYVFVHVMPELQGVRLVFVESASVQTRFEGMVIYAVALIGFMTFYGLDHLRKQVRDSDAEQREQAAFNLHVGGFAVYAVLVGYLLVHDLEEGRVPLLLFTTAMAVHFLAVDHALSEEHGEAYARRGRYWLAAMLPLGWAVGQLLALPLAVVALLVAFVSGAVIVNSSLMELPSEKEGHFVPFLAGGLLYALILLPLG
jgi:hypothetical protein